MTGSFDSVLPDIVASRERVESVENVLQQVREKNIETVRVCFADQHGILRGKTIMADDFGAVMESGLGITSTLLLKDTSHTTVFPVWGADAGFGRGQMVGASDVLMLPDPSTFKVLSWQPDSASILCDLFLPDGMPMQLSARYQLKNAIEHLSQHGMAFVCGLEVEFYVYRMQDPHLDHADTGKPGTPPETSLLAQGYQYLTDQHFDQLSPVMELIRRHARTLGLPVRTMESEFGPSQFEITFQPMLALEAADNMVLFRNMVKQVCRREGYHATFMCRPRLDNAMGNGWHLHQSLIGESAENLLMPAEGQALSAVGENWVAGILGNAAASCLLTTPTVNGYKRYQPYALAPDRVQWGQDNRGAMIRSLCHPGDPASRLENRVGEPAANPYMYIASQIYSGIDGISNSLTPPAAVEVPYENAASKLPPSLDKAIDAFAGSEMYRQAFGSAFVDYLLTIKRAEWQRFLQTVSDWEQQEYFSLF